jgi:hypothetical protein
MAHGNNWCGKTVSFVLFLGTQNVGRGCQTSISLQPHPSTAFCGPKYDSNSSGYTHSFTSWLCIPGSTVDYTITAPDSIDIGFEAFSDLYSEQPAGSGLIRSKWTRADYVCMSFGRAGMVAQTVMTCRNTVGSCPLQWLYTGGHETLTAPVPPVAAPTAAAPGTKNWFVKLTDDQQGCSASSFSEVIIYDTEVCVPTSTNRKIMAVLSALFD